MTEFEDNVADRQPGWLRSRFLGRRWPRDSLTPCGRRWCPVCRPGVEELPHIEAVESQDG